MSLIHTALHADTRAERIKALTDCDWTLQHAIARKQTAAQQLHRIAREMENDARMENPGKAPGCYCDYACECALQFYGTELQKKMNTDLHRYSSAISREIWRLERKQRFVRRLLKALLPQGQEAVPMQIINRCQRRRAA